METQSMLDALTDHLAVYHRSGGGDSATRVESRARQAVVEWLVSLSREQRRAALTVVDASWVAILLKMQSYLKAEGLCTFFLLPDVSVKDRPKSTTGAGSKGTRKGSGKGSSKGRKSNAAEESHSPAEGKKRTSMDFVNVALPLPELCFRRARGLVGRSEEELQERAGNLLVDSIRLFSSGDGEKRAKLANLDAQCTVDCATVTEGFVGDIGTFLKVMDDLSHDEFLNAPFLSLASTWEETSWLMGMGYYSLPAFIANKFEFELWAAWNRAQGTKKPARSLALKTKEIQNGWVGGLGARNSHGNAAVAASVLSRKQGCMDWWRILDAKERTNLAKYASALMTKFEVLKVVGEAKGGRGKVNSLSTRGWLRTVAADPGDSRLGRACKTSLSDSGVGCHVKRGTDDPQGAAELTSYLAGLRALRDMAESGFLSEMSHADSIQEDDTSWLFGSRLESVHKFSDHVRRRVRDALVKVRNDHIELELLEDESTGKAHGSNRGDNSEGKIPKTKKKKRKNTPSKAEVPKKEDKTPSPMPDLPQEERKQLEESQCDPEDEAEAQDRSAVVDQAVIETKPLSGGKQHVSRKGKGGKSKGKKDDKLHQPTLGLKKSAVNDEELARHILDIRSYSDGSVETGNRACSDCNGPPTSGDSPFDSSPSFEAQLEKSPATFSALCCSEEKRSSSCPTVNPGLKKPGKEQNAPTPPLHSTGDKNSVDNKESFKVSSDKEVSLPSTVSNGPPASDNSNDILSALLTAPPPLSQEPSTKIGVPPSCSLEAEKQQQPNGSCYPRTLNFDPNLVVEADKSPTSQKQSSASDTRSTNHLEPSTICFGTVGAALPRLKKTVSVPSIPLPRTCEERSVDTPPSNAKPIPCPRNGGRHRLPVPPRQFDYSTGRHAHYLQTASSRPGAHEWPGSPQFGYFGAYHQPKATDWLQLDVGWGWRHRMEPSLVSYRNAPVLRQQNGLAAENLIPVAVATRNGNGSNIDRLPLLQPSYNITPAAMGYAIASKEEPRLNVRPFFNPSPFSGYGDVDEYGPGRSVDDSDREERSACDTDGDDYGTYKSGEFDDLDGYMISEEEGERYMEDVTEGGSSDYHQIFGGGVMYWNSSDYAGLGYSRPGSLSSEDSSWARHEADLSVVLDDIVNYQPLQSSYSNVTSCSPSPPSSSSVAKLSPVASANARAFLPRPTGKDFTGQFQQSPNQGLSLDDQLVGARVPITVGVLEQIRADSSAQPILRPIVVVRERPLASGGEARRLQEAKSPHIVPRSRRNLPGHRPPSPVLRCVPPAPPPPPPSPVSGPRRRKGLMGARSGSSSPRHWGLVHWPNKDELEGYDGSMKGENPEGFHVLGRKRGNASTTPPMHPLSGALLRERLVSIPPSSLEQEHPDMSIPMKTTVLHSSNPALHSALTTLLSALHVEIEAFRLQVQAENKMRKPFIDMAVKKVTHSLQVLWPRSRINIFGSVATGLALPTSDVDLVICLPPVRNLEPIKEAGILEGRNGIKETSLQHAARYLADQDWVKVDSMKTIENTPVPIIMMVAEFLPHQCEMGDEDASLSLSPNVAKEAFEEGVKVEKGVAASELESTSWREVKNLEPEEKKGPWGGKSARQLVHLDISFETPSHTGLRTAELVRELVGLYPALSPLAVVLKQFLTDRSLDHPYSGGLSSYCLVLLITRFLQHQNHHAKLSSNQNLGKLFMDFLHFFGCVFDPLRMGIRIRGGGMYLSRDRFNDIDPLYIEDPLHPDNNVGRNCFRILQCVKAFADGYAVLEKKLHDISVVFEDVETGAESLQLLQMILPCIMTK